MRTLLVLALALPVAFAGDCGDDDEILEPEFDELAGSFEATSIRFVREDDARVSRDLVPAGGAMSLVIERDATFRSIFRTPEGVIVRRTGTLGIRGDRLIFEDDPFSDDDFVGESTFDFGLIGDRLVLLGEDREFVFREDIGAEPALLEVDLLRF